MTTSEPEANPHAGATPGYAGYEYQILVTVWLALDLMLDQSLADSITVEPASQEDIEAELRVPRDSAESICYAGVPSGRLFVKIKSRGTGPWSARDFAKIISEPVTQSPSSTRRPRPLEVLKQDDHALFLFITNAAVEGGLLSYRVDRASGSHNSEELPPHVRSIGNSVSGKRVRIIDGLTEEVITIRIRSILQRRGHVPSTELSGCIERLMSAVRSRLLGRVNRNWALNDIEAVLRSSAGLPEATEDISSYVEPLCYPEIQRKLQQSHVVVLVGTPGTGKTLTGRKLALDHQRDQTPFTVVNETAGPSAIFTCLQKADRYLFFLNDPWGASEVESGAARWNQELRRLLAQANPDKRFVITSRSDVVRSAAGASVNTYDQFVVAIVINADHQLSSVVRGNIKETVNEFLRNRIDVSDGHAFGELIRDISEWGLLDPTLDAVVNALTAGDKEGAEVFEIWHAPEMPATVVDEIRHSPLAQTIFHKFVRNVLPQTQKKYGRNGFLSFAAQFGLSLSSDFLAALDFLLEAEVLSVNSDLILHGALFQEDAFLDSTLDRIVALRNTAEKRFADLVADLDRARESELDVIQCDCAEDEAGDCWAVADDLLQEYVKARRSLQGFAFLCRFDSGSPTFSAWSRVLLEYDAAPSADEVTTFVERSEKIRERRWEVIAKHQRRDLADRFISDLCNSDAEVRRQCLKSLEGVIPAEDLPGKISSALLSCDWSRILEVYTDILRIESLRENAANIRAAIIASRSTNDSSLLNAIELIIHEASTEDLHKRCSAVSIGEIETAARRLDGVAKGYMLRILAAAGGNVVPFSESAITSDSEELVAGALDALDDQRSQDTIDQIRKALGQRSYRIRRHAMFYLAKSGTEGNQQAIFNMAWDGGAPGRRP